MSVCAVLVPESLAHADIAGVPAVVGLCAAVPAFVLYAVLGSYRHLLMATMSATAALAASVVAVYARLRALATPSPSRRCWPSSPVCSASPPAGVGLGFLASFISEVLRDFIVGAGHACDDSSAVRPMTPGNGSP